MDIYVGDMIKLKKKHPPKACGKKYQKFKKRLVTSLFLCYHH